MFYAAPPPRSFKKSEQVLLMSVSLHDYRSIKRNEHALLWFPNSDMKVETHIVLERTKRAKMC